MILKFIWDIVKFPKLWVRGSKAFEPGKASLSQVKPPGRAFLSNFDFHNDTLRFYLTGFTWLKGCTWLESGKVSCPCLTIWEFHNISNHFRIYSGCVSSEFWSSRRHMDRQTEICMVAYGLLGESAQMGSKRNSLTFGGVQRLPFLDDCRKRYSILSWCFLKTSKPAETTSFLAIPMN